MKEQITRTKLIHQGKANDVYETNVPGFLEMEATDRVSAGNGERKDVIPGKGVANNQISSAIFKYLEEHGVPTHYVCEGSNPASKLVKKAEMIPLEVIGRFTATGSFCKRYGVKDGHEFDDVFVEYTYKSDDAGDPPIDRKTISVLKILSEREVGLLDYYTGRIGELLFFFYFSLDVELVDFKVEYGCLPDGQIILCDEISPDTCRLRDLKTGEKLDKDRFRQNLSDVSKGYEEILKRVNVKDVN